MHLGDTLGAKYFLLSHPAMPHVGICTWQKLLPKYFIGIIIAVLFGAALALFAQQNAWMCCVIFIGKI